MLYLNNPLLTSEKIISWFETHLEQLSQVVPEGSKKPSQLSQLKNKLKANFFESLDKTASDQDVLTALSKDGRFISNYPKLKQVLTEIFSLRDADDKISALEKLKSINVSDWNTDTANTRLNQLNKKYGYFSETSPDLLALFTNLAISARVMIVLFEKNNTIDDTMAYDYAYKLMALFVDSSNLNVNTFDTISKDIYNLVVRNDNGKGHPFHDALMVKLELPPAQDLKDARAGWQDFVKQQGVRSFPSLAMAKKIMEQIIKQPNESILRAPKDLKEANKMLASCKYTRAAEDPDFAVLCQKYKVSENRFNLCLDYMAYQWPQKTKDSIPDIQIKGEGDAQGFYWLKLPVSDKRALILGDITDCCQSIGGHSERCVEDAVSEFHNGLYVLVKQRKPDGNPALIIHGEINDIDYKIIGQAYTWKGNRGGICLDSIECLNGSISQPALRSILSDFAVKLLQDNLDVGRVTLGCGGKTPANLFTRTYLPEKILSGFQYGDSATQYCIARTPVDVLNKQQREKFGHFLSAYDPKLKELFEDLIFDIKDPNDFVSQLENTEAFVKQLQILRSQDAVLERILDPDILSAMLKDKDLLDSLLAAPEEQIVEMKERILEEACNNHNDERVNELLLLGFPITQRLIKNIDPATVERLIPPIKPILEKLYFVDGLGSYYRINKGKLCELFLTTFIDEANSESHEIVTEESLEVFIKNKFNQMNEQKCTQKISNFKAEYLAIKDSYDSDKDDDRYDGPSIYEID